MLKIIGKDASGKVIAEEKTDSPQKAEWIASYWRSSGMAGGMQVEVTETP